MAGNDIVDLNLAIKESNWRRTGYLEKIFTVAERFLIQAAKDPDVMVWLLWTMKESVYKIYARETKIRTFSPTQLCCNNLILHDTTATGSIVYQDQQYFTESTIERNYLHTIAAINTELFGKLKLKIDSYDEADSSYRATQPLSVSHHGEYLALLYL